LEAGSYAIEVGVGVGVGVVPILSQLGGRELPKNPVKSIFEQRFQSSPSLEAGSYDRKTQIILIVPGFQSSPSLEAGSYIPTTIPQL